MGFKADDWTPELIHYSCNQQVPHICHVPGTAPGPGWEGCFVENGLWVKSPRSPPLHTQVPTEMDLNVHNYIQ